MPRHHSWHHPPSEQHLPSFSGPRRPFIKGYFPQAFPPHFLPRTSFSRATWLPVTTSANRSLSCLCASSCFWFVSQVKRLDFFRPQHCLLVKLPSTPPNPVFTPARTPCTYSNTHHSVPRSCLPVKTPGSYGRGGNTGMLCSPVAPRPLCALLQHAVCDAPFTDRLALSSSVRSNHCTDAVCRGSMTRAIRCRARLQHRSERIGFRLYGIALEPARVKDKKQRQEDLREQWEAEQAAGWTAHTRPQTRRISRCSQVSTRHSPICCFSKGSSISLRFARSRMSVQTWGKQGPGVTHILSARGPRQGLDWWRRWVLWVLPPSWPSARECSGETPLKTSRADRGKMNLRGMQEPILLFHTPSLKRLPWQTQITNSTIWHLLRAQWSQGLRLGVSLWCWLPTAASTYLVHRCPQASQHREHLNIYFSCIGLPCDDKSPRNK